LQIAAPPKTDETLELLTVPGSLLLISASRED